MMPALVALALRADGWYLRDEIIWHKPAPMPRAGGPTYGPMSWSFCSRSRPVPLRPGRHQ